MMLKLLLLLLPLPCLAQTGNMLMLQFPGVPSGSCAFIMMARDNATNDIYSCTLAGTWQKIAGGGGSGTVTSVAFTASPGTVTGSPITTAGTIHLGIVAADIVGLFSACSGTQYLGADGVCHTPTTGTVTSFSAGNLSPIFTTSVATATTTPALSFAISSIAAHNVLGNNTASSAAIAPVQLACADLSDSQTGCSNVAPANTTATSHQFFTAYTSATGVFTKAQPACGDLSDSQSGCTNVAPANTTVTAHQFFTAYTSATGVFTKAQPACADLSDAGSGCSSSSSGTVTQINTVLPISGGPITTTGTISCPNCAIVNNNSYQPNQLLAGCGVQYTTGLTFTVGDCTYTVAGITYSSAATSVTLSAADPTNPRIDLIIVDVTSTVSVLTGTPAATPQAPTIDPSTQLEVTFVQVNAGATTPANITNTTLYDENTGGGGGEWTATCSTNLNCGSTNNPYHLTHDIEATAAVLTNNFTLVKPSAGTIDLATVNTLVFYIRSKAQWPTGGGGANAQRSLSLSWLNGSTQRGSAVVLQDGVFGFSSSNTTTYQQISIPVSLFGANGILVTTLQAQVTGKSGTSSIGFYIDWVTLQGGSGAVILPGTLMNFQGTWNASKTYALNDVVAYRQTGYVSQTSNNNVIPFGNSATWTPLAGAVRSFGSTFDGGGSALTSGKTVYFTIPYACTISAWNIAADTGTATVDIWKIATGTAIPTVANTIVASAAPALASGTAIHSTTLTGWTTSVSANDIFGFNLKTVSGATFVNIVVECDQ